MRRMVFLMIFSISVFLACGKDENPGVEKFSLPNGAEYLGQSVTQLVTSLGTPDTQTDIIYIYMLSGDKSVYYVGFMFDENQNLGAVVYQVLPDHSKENIIKYLKTKYTYVDTDAGQYTFMSEDSQVYCVFDETSSSIVIMTLDYLMRFM